MRYYVNGKEIVFVKKIGEGEEADIYLTDDKQVAKIFKSDRRVDIRKPDLEFYKYLMNFDLSSFYFNINYMLKQELYLHHTKHCKH